MSDLCFPHWGFMLRKSRFGVFPIYKFIGNSFFRTDRIQASQGYTGSACGCTWPFYPGALATIDLRSQALCMADPGLASTLLSPQFGSRCHPLVPPPQSASAPRYVPALRGFFTTSHLTSSRWIFFWLPNTCLVGDTPECAQIWLGLPWAMAAFVVG